MHQFCLGGRVGDKGEGGGVLRRKNLQISNLQRLASLPVDQIFGKCVS